MNSIFLNSYTIVYLFSEVITLLLAFILLGVDLKLFLKWDFNSSSKEQFNLERLAYLASVLALFLLIAKFIIAIYFIYTIDSLALYIPGAMCAAGVISANSYGILILETKAVTLFLLTLWVALQKYDIEAKNYPIFKQKSALLIIISILIIVETILDFSYFSHIDTTTPVSCCSTLYGNLEGQNPLPFNLSISNMLILFVSTFTALLLSILLDKKITSILLVALFGFISYYVVVYFFGTYIYELPTHKCPYCMMQKEYYYIGYLIWGSLFLTISFTTIWAIMGLWLKVNVIKLKKYAIINLAIFIIINFAYVAIYYIKNGVFL